MGEEVVILPHVNASEGRLLSHQTFRFQSKTPTTVVDTTVLDTLPRLSGRGPEEESVFLRKFKKEYRDLITYDTILICSWRLWWFNCDFTSWGLIYCDSSSYSELCPYTGKTTSRFYDDFEELFCTGVPSTSTRNRSSSSIFVLPSLTMSDGDNRESLHRTVTVVGALRYCRRWLSNARFSFGTLV